MPKCHNCDYTQFHVVNGVYCCDQCETECEQREEEGNEDHQITSNVSEIRSSVKRKVVQVKVDTSTKTWLSFEVFGIILCHQVNTLIELGASPQLKKVVFQLWAIYLQKCEICFNRNTLGENWRPRLGPMPRRRDLQVLCGAQEIKSKKRKKNKHHRSSKRSKKNSEVDPPEVASNSHQESLQDADAPTISSISELQFEVVPNSPQESLQDADAPAVARPTVSSTSELQFPKRTPSTCKRRRLSFSRQESRKRGGAPPAVISHIRKRLPDYMVLHKTLSFCYLGILLIEDMLLLGDIIRFAKEGHFPYMDAISYLPSHLKLTHGDHHMLMPGVPPTMRNSILYSTALAKFLRLPRLRHPPLLPIAARFIQDFNLPRALINHVDTVILELQHKEYWYPCNAIKINSIRVQCYEAKAMAAILVTLKLLFCLNGTGEEQHSKLVSKINVLSPCLKLFVWSEWFSVMQLKAEFLRSRSMSYSRISQTMDIESLAVFYQTTFQKWSSKLPHTRKKTSLDSDFRSSLRSTLSDVVLKKNFSGVSLPPTSFPLSSNSHHGIVAAKSSRQHSASKFFDCDLLKKDFSTCSVHYSHRRYKQILSSNAKASKLLKKLNDKFYCGKSSDTNLNSPYWYLKCARKDYRTVYESAPPTFKWLIDFSSELIECDKYELFYEVCTLEKAIFKFK